MSRKPSTLQSASKETWPSSLDDGGYVIFPDALGANEVATLRDAFEAYAAREERVGGTRHVVLDDVEAFRALVDDTRLRDAIQHVLHREPAETRVSGRDPLPGFGQQGLHTDWPSRLASEPYYAVTALWLLDGFTPDNGATRVVPGTHRLGGTVPKEYADPNRRHGSEKIIVAPAGALLVFNGHLWHSGTRNRSSGPRRAVQCVMTAR